MRAWVKPMGALVAAAGLALLVWRWPAAEEGAAEATPPDVDAPTPIRLADGSAVHPSGDARVAVLSQSPANAELALEAGKARFEVVPNPARRFRVAAGLVTVDVLGTVFDVERLRERVRVTVHRGRVRVGWEGREATLGAGSSGIFPPEAPAPSGAEPPSAEPAPTAAAPRARSMRARPGAREAGRWETLARDGLYGDAYEALEGEGGASAVHGSAQALLLAADVARLSGHPRNAVQPLRRALARHPGDARAPLAAFTLGRVYLEELGQPREAAAAFAKARQLRPNGSLAEDALAREVEAWDRAGEASRARERALEYLRLFPRGRRAPSVRRHGGVP
ncbi:MAG: FecR family protein [Myxococcota bacterium]